MARPAVAVAVGAIVASVILAVAALVAAVCYRADRRVSALHDEIRNEKEPDWFDASLLPLLRNKQRKAAEAKSILRMNYFFTLVSRAPLGSTSWASLERRVDSIRVPYRPDVVLGIKSGGAFIARLVARRWDPPPRVEYIKIQKYAKKSLFQRVLMWVRYQNGRRADDQRRRESEEQADRALVVGELPDPNLIRGRSVLVVDDQVYSGSTLRRACKEMRLAGATAVTALTVSAVVGRSRDLVDHCSVEGAIFAWPWGMDS